MDATPSRLTTELSGLLLRLNSAVLDAGEIGNKAASEALSTAWSAVYDARALLERNA